MQQCKLLCIKTLNVRTPEVLGYTDSEPLVGKTFKMTAKPIFTENEENMRLIETTPVKHIFQRYFENTWMFQTESGSIYQVYIYPEVETVKND